LTTIPALYTPHTVGLAYMSFVLIEVKIFTVVAYCLGMMTSCTFLQLLFVLILLVLLKC
jgi:hypothetical protein